MSARTSHDGMAAEAPPAFKPQPSGWGAASSTGNKGSRSGHTRQPREQIMDSGWPETLSAAFSPKAVLAVFLPVLFLVLLAIGWQTMARALSNPLIPDAWSVLRETAGILLTGKFVQQACITVYRVTLGFAAAFFVSMVLGIGMGRSWAFRQFAEPAILIGLTVPGLVWALLCVIWFGISLATPVVAVALCVAPPLTLNVAQGVRTASPELLEVAAAYQLSPAARLRFLWLPSLYPFLLSGIRIGLSMAWKVIVLVEVFGLSSGIGYQLNLAFSSQNVAGVLAWTIGFALIMAAIEYGFLGNLERRVTRWRRTAKV